MAEGIAFILPISNDVASAPLPHHSEVIRNKRQAPIRDSFNPLTRIDVLRALTGFTLGHVPIKQMGTLILLLGNHQNPTMIAGVASRVSSTGDYEELKELAGVELKWSVMPEGKLGSDENAAFEGCGNAP